MHKNQEPQQKSMRAMQQILKEMKIICSTIIQIKETKHQEDHKFSVPHGNLNVAK